MDILREKQLRKMEPCVCVFGTNLRWLVAMAPSSVAPLHDGSRLGGIVLSLRKPSNLCRRDTWPKQNDTHSDGNKEGQTDGERQRGKITGRSKK